MPLTPQELSAKVFEVFNKRITDEIFSLIENDSELMEEYSQTVKEYGEETTNQTIGKQVRERYNLTPSGKNPEPRSTLIKVHTEFE